MTTIQHFRIGRVYNKHGISDYYHRTGNDGSEWFSGIGVAASFAIYSDAWNKAAQLKERVPCIMGGAPITYEVEEFTPRIAQARPFASQEDLELFTALVMGRSPLTPGKKLLKHLTR